MGRHMQEERLHFDSVLASPAARVEATLAEVANGYGQSIAPAWERRLYLASTADLLDIVHDAPDTAESLLLVGHNPGLQQLALLLIAHGKESGARNRVEEKYPTASLAEIVFEVDRWADITADSGTLARFVRPRDIDPALGPDTD